ncbi:MAG: hypothetical protein HY788_17135 [Deltaproteobacteria bacterium]|nr:hypothetical protein [Deltaproteobacteria bacterium]
MPWNEILESLNVFTFWQTYAALSAYLTLILLPHVFEEMVPEEHARAHFMVVIIKHAFQAYGTLFLVLSMAPILLGISAEDGWDFAAFSARDPSYLVRFVLTQSALLFGSIILAVLPVVRHMHSLHVAVLSCLGLILVLPVLDAYYPGLGIHRLSLLPEPVYLAGFVLFAAVMVWVGAMTSRRLLEARDAELTAVSVSTIFGLAPFVTYGLWLGIQLDSLLFPVK